MSFFEPKIVEEEEKILVGLMAYGNDAEDI